MFFLKIPISTYCPTHWIPLYSLKLGEMSRKYCETVDQTRRSQGRSGQLCSRDCFTWCFWGHFPSLALLPDAHFLIFFLFILYPPPRAPLYFCFLGLHVWHMEVPRLGVKSELQLPICTTATATRDLTHICDLYHSSQQRRILNPLSEARG